MALKTFRLFAAQERALEGRCLKVDTPGLIASFRGLGTTSDRSRAWAMDALRV